MESARRAFDGNARNWRDDVEFRIHCVSQLREGLIRSQERLRRILVTEIEPTEALPGQPLRLRLSGSDDPGLTYCFARGRENREVLNTWVAVQRFEHGVMTWRQDRPGRIEVGHDDTSFAPELQCLDVFADTWKPGMELSYGESLSHVLSVATKYHVVLPRALVLLSKQLLYFERYARELAPDYVILADPRILEHLLG